MAGTMRILELRIPLRLPFSNARRTVARRRTLLVGITESGITGWGEAAPYPGYTAETADEVWEALVTRDGISLPPTARAAVDQARQDLSARRRGVPLWSQVGGDGRPVPACAAIGLERSPARTVDRVERATEAGIREVKIKIEPGRDRQYLGAVRERFPQLRIAADANGSFLPGDRFLAEVDDLDLLYIEQPLPAGHIQGHAELAARFSTPVCLDESAATMEGALRVVEEGVADIVSLKPGLLGVTGTVSLMDQAEAAGIRVKIGGLVETSVGRSHALALATRPSVAFTDLVPPDWLLSGDVSSRPWRLVDGHLSPGGLPGIGVEIGEEALADYLARSHTLTIETPPP